MYKKSNRKAKKNAGANNIPDQIFSSESDKEKDKVINLGSLEIENDKQMVHEAIKNKMGQKLGDIMNKAE